MNRVYRLRPDSIDYDHFRIDADVKTLYWTPDDKKILLSTTRGGVRFLASSTLALRYGVDGTDALRRSLVERHLAREHQKLTETDDTEMQREIGDRIRKFESVLSDIEL